MNGYTTLAAEAEAAFTEKRSRFVSAVAPVSSEEEAAAYLAARKQKHWEASSTVYAYLLREGDIRRYSDGGEPQGTGGIPTLEVLRRSGVCDVIVVTSRYFGGIKLGAGGLARAFSHSAALALAAGERRELRLCRELTLEFDYSFYSQIQRLVAARPARTLESDFGARVRLQLLLREEELPSLCDELTELSAGTLTPVIGKQLFESL